MKRGYSAMRCGLIGEHLPHSFSPRIHALIADYSYTLTELRACELESFARKDELDAYNVTIPYKKAIMPYLDVISDEARAIGAVNTVVRRDGKLYGYNTDFFGFSYMLDASGVNVEGKKILILGKGGAAATVSAVLRGRGAAEIIMLGSRDNTAENIARHSDADVLVNTSPVGMYPNNLASPVDLSVFKSLAGVLDVIYNPARTALLIEAERLCIPCANGLSMLVAQAARAAELFTGEAVSEDEIAEVARKIERSTQNIILIGMPGCGKSTVAKIIAEKLDRPFIDADDAFAASFGRTPAEVIESEGEDAFRELEHAVALELGKQSGAVIACGGGIVTRNYNYAPLHQNGTIVLLRRALGELSRRGRPLSSGSLKALYDSRREAYEAFADVTADSTGVPEKTAELIITLTQADTESEV